MGALWAPGLRFQRYSQFCGQAAPPGALRPHLEEWQASGPLLSVRPNTDERGAAVSSWGQRGPLQGSQTAALNRRGSFAPSTVTPRTSAAPWTAPCWVSASPGLNQGGSGRFSPSQHSWNSSAGPAPPRNALVLYCVCFSSRQSKPLQTWWHKRAMSICYYPPLAWSGSYGLSQFSLRVSPGCRRSRVGFEPPPGLPQARVWWLMLAVG